MVQEFVEALVVLDEGGVGGEWLEELRQHAVVLQWLPPRLAIVLVEADVPVPHGDPGTRWYPGDIPAEVAADFTPSERVFVDGWLARREGKNDPNSGSGLEGT
jgi:hypothetical protein